MPKRRYSFWIDEEHLAGLREVRERDGVLESEQIRRALSDWLETRATKCPVCRRSADRHGRGDDPQTIDVRCSRCGSYPVDTHVLKELRLAHDGKGRLAKSLKALSAALRSGLIRELTSVMQIEADLDEIRRDRLNKA
jgi:hypothetical protein